MRSSVFPEPAGACTMKERDGSRARSRWAESGMRSASFIAIALVIARDAEGRLLRDAAEHLLVAGTARFGPALRIDARVARREAPPDRFQLDAPSRHQLAPIAVAARGLALVLVDGADPGNELRGARDAPVARLARAHHGKGDGSDVFAPAERVHRQLRLVGPLAHPRGGLARAGLVVDDRAPSGSELVHAVELRVDGDAAEGDRMLLLDRHDVEIAASRVELEPIASEPNQACPLEAGIARAEHVGALSLHGRERPVRARFEDRAQRLPRGGEGVARPERFPPELHHLLHQPAPIA